MNLHRTTGRGSARSVAQTLVFTCAALSGLALSCAPVLAAPTAAEMRDLPSDHWAYKAIQQLMERYGVMEGFPDATFRGNKTVTRYELAAALNKVMLRLDAVAATAGKGGASPVSVVNPTLSAADKATIEKLKGEFKSELTSLNARVEKSEGIVKELQDKIGSMVKLSGKINTMLADETLDVGKDRTAPYITTDLSLSLTGKLSEATTYNTSLSAAVKAAGSGDKPGAMGGGSGPSTDALGLRSARFTSKIGSTTVNVGRFPLWLVGFGPSTTQSFVTGGFTVGTGDIGPDVSALRVGSDVNATFSTDIGPATVSGGLNSNILITQIKAALGPVTLQGGFETDHKAITQNLFNTGQRVKTTDNAAFVADFGGEGPFGATLQANMTNLSLTSYGGGLRGTFFGDTDVNLVTVLNSDPKKSVTVATFGLTGSLPSRELFGGKLQSPSLLVGIVDNYTVDAPGGGGGSTTGPGGQALGKNAGVSVQLGIPNPWIPKLTFEYNAQAKLVESIFLPNAKDPITSETIVLRSSVGF